MNVTQLYKVYIEFDALNEIYELTSPTVSAHNLVIGTLYLD
jgi:hypothetical protein